jgi:hypothetical protein
MRCAARRLAQRADPASGASRNEVAGLVIRDNIVQEVGDRRGGLLRTQSPVISSINGRGSPG